MTATVAADATRTVDTAGARLASPACKAASPRVPAPLDGLEWVRSAQDAERVFAGESAPRDPDARFDDPEAAGISWVTIREIDLTADGICDLVVTAIDSVGTAGAGPGHSVYWFFQPQGWRRQGPDWGQRSAGFNAVSRALLGPDSPGDFRVHGFGNYAPAVLQDGRVVLVVHAGTGVNAARSAPLLAYDQRSRAVAPLDADAIRIAQLAENLCVTLQSEDPACMTW